jgi:16S rRNA (guanine527-N7)-methyltransferase
LDPLERILADGLVSLNLAASAEQISRLMDFLRLLRKWNRVYNLTAIENPAQIVRLHLLDSLAVLPYLQGRRVLDVGTGAGLPGIPLALFAPELAFTLLDSNAKKIRFVQQASIELGLANVHAEHVRIEQFQASEGFDTILARAFAALPSIVADTAGLLKPDGVILAQKGKLPEEEITPLHDYAVKVHALNIPGVDAERHLIAIQLRG